MAKSSFITVFSRSPPTQSFSEHPSSEHQPTLQAWYRILLQPSAPARAVSGIGTYTEEPIVATEYPYFSLYLTGDDIFSRDKDVLEKIHWMGCTIKGYDLVTHFEGSFKGNSRPAVIFTVFLEATNIPIHEVEHWYKTEHLEALSRLPNYRCSTVYKTIEEANPQFLVIHECDCVELNEDITAWAIEAEWSKRIMYDATFFERKVWELGGEGVKRDA